MNEAELRRREWSEMGKKITETESNMYSVAEAAARLHMDEKGFRAAIQELGIPTLRVGYRILIPIVAFENWMRERGEAQANEWLK